MDGGEEELVRAKYGDIEVCPRCNGTGSRTYVSRGLSYSVPCRFTGFETRGQLSLLPTETVKQAKARIGARPAKRRSRGNRWHSKN